jgi:class 3 adenylate cyclase
VNIAARIEPKADADGIMVSEVIQEESNNKVPAHFVSTGRPPMKNIANPPELFKVFPLEDQGGGGGGAAKMPAGAAESGAGGNTFRI